MNAGRCHRSVLGISQGQAGREGVLREQGAELHGAQAFNLIHEQGRRHGSDSQRKL